MKSFVEQAYNEQVKLARRASPEYKAKAKARRLARKAKAKALEEFDSEFDLEDVKKEFDPRPVDVSFILR